MGIEINIIEKTAKYVYVFILIFLISYDHEAHKYIKMILNVAPLVCKST